MKNVFPGAKLYPHCLQYNMISQIAIVACTQHRVSFEVTVQMLLDSFCCWLPRLLFVSR